MEWLSLLVAHPKALSAFIAWLIEQEHQCNNGALDVPIEDIPKLKGKREAYISMQAYVHNNVADLQRQQV